MTTRTMEILVGVFVAAGLAALFTLALQVSNLGRFSGGVEGYRLNAWFENIGGLKVRAPVTISGVTIGRVSGIKYDRKRFQAEVNLAIDGQYDYLPRDTTVSIYTSGLLGEQYVALEPGAAQDTLKDGDELRFTQSAVVLEDLISQVLSQGGTSQ